MTPDAIAFQCPTCGDVAFGTPDMVGKTICLGDMEGEGHERTTMIDASQAATKKLVEESLGESLQQLTQGALVDGDEAMASLKDEIRDWEPDED